MLFWEPEGQPLESLSKIPVASLSNPLARLPAFGWNLMEARSLPASGGRAFLLLVSKRKRRHGLQYFILCV